MAEETLQETITRHATTMNRWALAELLREAADELDTWAEYPEHLLRRSE